MKITVCIGSSCHVKGAHDVVTAFQKLIAEKNMADKVELGGTFCLGNCQAGVGVKIGEEVYSVTPDTAEEFFVNEVLSKVQ